jgi:hypothetical protein
VARGFKARADLGLLALLAAHFPVVRRLVGEDSFHVMARRFIHHEPPGRLRPPGWCDAFPRFLRSQGTAATFDYVADIAALESACSQARAVAAVKPVAAQVLSSLLSSLPDKRLDRLRLALHPSVHLVASRFPIVTIWTNNRRGAGGGMIERWGAETALVVRPSRTVEVRRLQPGGHAFLTALGEGQTVAAALALAAGSAGFDIDAGRAILIESGVVVGVRDDSCRNPDQGGP